MLYSMNTIWYKYDIVTPLFLKQYLIICPYPQDLDQDRMVEQFRLMRLKKGLRMSHYGLTIEL